MKSTHSTRGFTVVELLLIVLGVTVIGFIGYRVWEAHHQLASQSTPPVATTVAPIKTSSDLESTDTDIQKLDIDGSELNDLDAQLNY